MRKSSIAGSEKQEMILSLRNYEAVKPYSIMRKLITGRLEPDFQQDYRSASYYVHRKETQSFISGLIFLDWFKKATVSGVYENEYVSGLLFWNSGIFLVFLFGFSFFFLVFIYDQLVVDNLDYCIRLFA